MKRMICMVMVMVLMGLGSANAAVVGQWDFEGNLEAAVGTDDGTIYNPYGGTHEYVAGYGGGQALHLTSFDTEVDIGTGAAGFNPGTGDFTFTGWFKITNLAAASERLKAFSVIQGWGEWNNTYARLVNNAFHNTGGIFGSFGNYADAPDWLDAMAFAVKGPSDNPTAWSDDHIGADDNEWHWVGYRVASGAMSVWFDGASVGTNSYGGGATLTDGGTRTTKFGGWHDDMVIDSFTVWDEALSDTDMYNNFIPEPATLSILVLGALALGYRRRLA